MNHERGRSRGRGEAADALEHGTNWRLAVCASRWLGLLVLLVALLAGWIHIMHRVKELPPEGYWHGYEFDACENSITRIFNIPPDSNDHRELMLELPSGKIRTRETRFNIFQWKQPVGEADELTAIGSTTFLLRPVCRSEGEDSEAAVIECPGENHVVIHKRFLFGNDAKSFYLWDASQPAESYRSIPNPLNKPLKALASRQHGRVVAWPTQSNRSMVIDSPGGGLVFRGEAESNAEADTLEAYFDSVPGDPAMQEICLLAFGNEEMSGEPCSVLASWQALENGTSRMTFPDSPAAVIDGFVVSVSPDANGLEYRSLADGHLDFVVPVPKDLDLVGDRWRFLHGQLQVGQYGARWVFDLQSQRRIDIPGGEAYCAQRFPEDQLAFFWRPAERTYFDSRGEGQWILMDEQSGKPALVASSDRGTPVRIDGERVAFCSDRYSLSAEIVNWKTGQTETWIAPRRWLAPVLCLLAVGSFAWVALWLMHSKLSGVPLWLDGLALLLPFLALALHWLYHFGSSAWRSSQIDDLLRQSVAAVFCSSLVALFVLLKHQAYRKIVKVLIAMLCLASLAAILRLGLVELPPLPSPTGDEFIILPSYDGFWTVHGFLLLDVSAVALTLFVFRRRGWGLSSVKESVRRFPSTDQNAVRTVADPSGDLASPSRRSSRPRIVDWMLLTAVVALCLQVYRPAIWDWEDLILGVFLFWLGPEVFWGAWLSTAMLVFALVTAFSSSRFLFAVGVSVSLLLALWTLFHPIVDFVAPRAAWESWVYENLGFYVTTAWMVFLFCFLLRRRGWQFRSQGNAAQAS